MADDTLGNASSETSDVDLLVEGSEEETPNETVEETSETSPETTEETEEEAPDEEELEAKTDEEEIEDEEEEITRPSWKEIKEKYPEIAKNKDFQEMFHREKAYSEVFPTVADARDSAEKSQVFDFFDNSLAEGNPKVLIESLNEQTITKFADNILPALYSTNPQIFARATQPLIVEILHNIDERATSNNDKNLKLSVQNISKALFGKFELPPKIQRNLDPEVEQEKQALKSEREQLLQGQRSEFLASSDKSIKRQLSSILFEGLDPKGILSDFTKNAIIKETLDETRAILGSDKAFVSKMQHLARLAERAGYPPDYRPRIISAYLGRAKAIALGLRAKHKAAAIGRRVTNNKNNVNRVESRGEKDTSQNSNKKGSSSKGKSDLDIIMEGA